MKVLLNSHMFDPSLGGIETVSRTLAEGFVARGISCKVVTQSPGPGTQFPFEVIRQPNRQQVHELVDWADIVLFNGASVAMQPKVLFSRKPFVWVHQGYQAASIDGSGWVDGERSPLTPWASFVYHGRRSGWITGIVDGLKLMVRRFFATRLVTRNIAITQWMNRLMPLPRQVHIYNPFSIEQFRDADGRPTDHTFFYAGRMVQEKGVDTLIRAFATVVQRSSGTQPRLLLIGDGTGRPAIEKLVKELGLESLVTFAGKQSGAALVDWVSRGQIGVLPSVWYEPMGGITVELMAAGKALIVSAEGGLAECAGDTGLTFPNGDHATLAERMLQLLADPELQRVLSARARERSKEFLPSPFVDQYVALLRELSGQR